MENLNKRENLKDVLELKETGHIPVIITPVSIGPVQYGYSMMDIILSPEKFAECYMGTREKFGYDGLVCCLGHGVASMMAGHLVNADGQVSGNGEETINGKEDFDKLKPYNPDEDMMINNAIKTMEIMRKEQPNEPTYAVIQNPASTAIALMGAQRAFRLMVKDPDVFIEFADAMVEPVVSAVKRLIDAGIDFIWSPTPNLGGFCISRKTYEKCCWPSNKKYGKAIHDTGTKHILHTCGPYDDRFDLVLEEYGDGWHIANTETKKVKDQYGDKLAIMGSIPSVAVVMEGTAEEVYNFAYQECMDGGHNGGFILSADCDIPPSTPEENIRAIVKAARDAEKAIHNK